MKVKYCKHCKYYERKILKIKTPSDKDFVECSNAWCKKKKKFCVEVFECGEEINE